MSVQAINYALRRLGVSYKKNSGTPQSVAKTHGNLTKTRLNNYKVKGARLFILMKVALLMICLVRTAMRFKGNDVMAYKIGMHAGEATQLAH